MIVSGCANPLGDGSSNGDTGTITSGPSGNGLEITRFAPADSTLGTGERTIVVLNLKNYHTEEDVNIEEISLYNTGELETNFEGCTPSKENLEPAQEEFRPEMECRWSVEAPEEVGGFDEKSVSMNLFLKYDSALRTSNPVEVEFKPFDEINSTRTASFGEDNGEVEANLKTETPIPTEGSRTIDISVKSVGDGRIEDNYEFEFTPSNLFEDCEDDVESSDRVEKKTVVDDDVTLSCTLTSENQNNRQLYVSTYYKYIKEPSLGITLVNK